MSKLGRVRKKLRRKKYNAFPPWIKVASARRTINISTLGSYFTYMHRRDPLLTRAQFRAEARVGPINPFNRFTKFNLSGESGPFKFLRPAVTQLECQWMVDVFKLPELKDHVIESINVTHDEINIVTSQYKRLKL